MDRKWWTLTAVCIAVFMLLLDVTIVIVALPPIRAAFHAPLTDLQWVVDAYALALAALLLTAGSVADRVGRRRVFALGITVFTLGSALCGLAGDSAWLAAFRAVQGVGGAMMFATSLALLAAAFPPDRRGTAFGIFGAVTGSAVAVGPVLGGLLTSGLSWRWIFLVNIPIGLVALLITLTRVAESKAPVARRPDRAGLVTFSLGLTGLVLGLIRSEPDGWGSPVVLGCLFGAVVLLAGFVVIETRTTDPMFDLGLLRVPTFTGGLIAAWAVSASILSLLTYLVIYLQGTLGYDALDAGLRVLPLSVASFFASALAGRLADALPARWLISPGFLLVGTGILLMRGVEPGQSWTHLVTGFVVAGFGTGLINVPLAGTAVSVVSADRAGMASGANSTFRQVGIATGVAALGSVFAARITDGLQAGLSPAAASTGALNDILLIGAVIALAAGVLVFPLVRRRDIVHAAVPASPETRSPAAATVHPGGTR
jgi:EmrB/QacA subfamily drug resistance transporter